MAASTALPPAAKISMPAEVASWSALATAWRGARTELMGWIGPVGRVAGDIIATVDAVR
jgi:hypothetical protein